MVRDKDGDPTKMFAPLFNVSWKKKDRRKKRVCKWDFLDLQPQKSLWDEQKESKDSFPVQLFCFPENCVWKPFPRPLFTETEMNDPVLEIKCENGERKEKKKK